MRISTFVVACATVATAFADVAKPDPTLMTKGGKLYSVVDGIEFDHGDMASKAVQKRSTENVIDLLKELIASNKDTVASNKAVASSVDGLVRADKSCLMV